MTRTRVIIHEQQSEEQSWPIFVRPYTPLTTSEPENLEIRCGERAVLLRMYHVNETNGEYVQIKAHKTVEVIGYSVEKIKTPFKHPSNTSIDMLVAPILSEEKKITEEIENIIKSIKDQINPPPEVIIFGSCGYIPRQIHTTEWTSN